MTYATQKLTESLQELTKRSSQQGLASSQLPKSIPASELRLSSEVASFLKNSREYARRSREVNVGSY